jgi:hypothetical protein
MSLMNYLLTKTTSSIETITNLIMGLLAIILLFNSQKLPLRLRNLSIRIFQTAGRTVVLARPALAEMSLFYRQLTAQLTGCR